MRVRDAGMRCNVGSESQLRMTGDKLLPALRGNPYNVYIPRTSVYAKLSFEIEIVVFFGRSKN